jgi:hypothetical protein
MTRMNLTPPHLHVSGTRARTDVFADCGHRAQRAPYLPGFVTDRTTNKTLCYTCAAEAHAAKWDTAPEGHKDIAYLTQEKAPGGLGPFTLTTWTGEQLARITRIRKSRCWGFGGWHTRYTFNAIDRKGNPWHGTSPGPGMYARATRSKGKR